MVQISKDFADQRRQELFQSLSPPPRTSTELIEPWLLMKNGEMPPMMFQLRRANGERLSFAYSDLREVRFRDAGCVQLGVLGMTRFLITIEGRHLQEMADGISFGLIRWMQEADERELDLPESQPCIESILIEPFPTA